MLNPFEPDYSDASGDIQKAQGYFNPYYQAGTRALKGYGGASAAMMAHPTGLEDRIMKGYNMSPYAQYQTNELTGQMNRQAGAAGDLGTPNEQAALARNTQGIVSGDQQQYVQNAMQPYHWGMEGMQDISHMGQSAAGSMAGLEMGQERLDENLANFKPQMEGAIFGGIGKGVGYAAGSHFL